MPRVVNRLMTNTMRDIEAREKARGYKFIGVPGRDDRPRRAKTARAKPKTVKRTPRPKLVQPVKLDQFGGADASAPIRPATNVMEMRKRFDDTRARQYSDNADFAAKSRRKKKPTPAPKPPIHLGKEAAKAAGGAAVGTGLGAVGDAAWKVARYRTGKGDWGVRRAIELYGKNPGAYKLLKDALKSRGAAGLISGAKATLPYAAIGGAAYLAGKYLEKKHPKFRETQQKLLEDYKKKYGESDT